MPERFSFGYAGAVLAALALAGLLLAAACTTSPAPVPQGAAVPFPATPGPAGSETSVTVTGTEDPGLFSGLNPVAIQRVKILTGEAGIQSPGQDLTCS